VKANRKPPKRYVHTLGIKNSKQPTKKAPQHRRGLPSSLAGFCPCKRSRGLAAFPHLQVSVHASVIAASLRSHKKSPSIAGAFFPKKVKSN